MDFDYNDAFDNFNDNFEEIGAADELRAVRRRLGEPEFYPPVGMDNVAPNPVEEEEAYPLNSKPITSYYRKRYKSKAQTLRPHRFRASASLKKAFQLFRHARYRSHRTSLTL